MMDGGSSVIDVCVGCMESVLHLLSVYEGRSGIVLTASNSSKQMLSIFAIICDV